MSNPQAGVSSGLGVTPPPGDGLTEHPIDVGAAPAAAGAVPVVAASPEPVAVRPELPTAGVGLVENTPPPVVNSVPVENPIAGMQVSSPSVSAATSTLNGPKVVVPMESREQLETKAKVLINDLNKNKGSQPPAGGAPPKKKGVNIAAAGLALTALVLMVAGGAIGIRFLGMPGSQEQRSQAACIGSAICNIPGNTETFCKGTEVWTHSCVNTGTDWCWDAGSEQRVKNCADSGQLCTNTAPNTADCYTPSTGNSCAGTIIPSGNGLRFDVNFCEGQLWSATAYICSNRDCGNHPTYGVCHTACSPGAQAVGIGSGEVDSNPWFTDVSIDASQIGCKLVQIDGAVNNGAGGQITGHTIIDNLDNSECAPPTVTPTTPPGVTPSPTVPALACTVMGVTNEQGVAVTQPNLGDTLALNCSGTPASGLTKEYQYSHNNGVWTDLTANPDGTADLLISQVGSYNVQCRVCRNINECTQWQTATN